MLATLEAKSDLESTPGEVRGHAGGKKGQAMGGKRGTAKSRTSTKNALTR